MRKFAVIFSLLLLAGGELFGQGIKFVQNKTWDEVKAIAAKENKMIFLDAYATWCGPCIYMQKKVFTSSEAGAYFNKNFINVKMDMEQGEGPELAEAFGLTAYPTLYFFGPDGRMLHKYIGAMETEDFIALAQDARVPEKQFYTLKSQALAGKLGSEQFHRWIHEADEFGEEDVAEVITTYLAGIPDLTVDKDMAIIALDHAPRLTKAQMTQLSRQTDKLAVLAGVTKEEITGKLYEKMIE